MKNYLLKPNLNITFLCVVLICNELCSLLSADTDEYRDKILGWVVKRMGKIERGKMR